MKITKKHKQWLKDGVFYFKPKARRLDNGINYELIVGGLLLTDEEIQDLRMVVEMVLDNSSRGVREGEYEIDNVTCKWVPVRG